MIVSVKRSPGYSSDTLRVLVHREDILISSYSGSDHPEMIINIRSVVIASPAPVIFIFIVFRKYFILCITHLYLV